MNLGCNEVIDLLVFDEDENLVAKLDSLKNSQIFSNDGQCWLGITDALFNLDLQKFIHGGEENKLTDFQLASKGYKKKLSIKKHSTKKCKLIGTTIMRKQSGEDVPLTFECQNVEIANDLNFKMSSLAVSDFDYMFRINEDKEGNFIDFILNDLL